MTAPWPLPYGPHTELGEPCSLGPGPPPLGVLCSLCCSMLVQWLPWTAPWSAWDRFLITSLASPPGHVPENSVLSIPLACLSPSPSFAPLNHGAAMPLKSSMWKSSLFLPHCPYPAQHRFLRSCHAFGSHSSWLWNGAGPVVAWSFLHLSIQSKLARMNCESDMLLSCIQFFGESLLK